MRQTKLTREQLGDDLWTDLPKHARIKLTLRERLRHMKPGQILSGIRALRSEFGVSQGPVDRALRDLQQEGLVATRHGSGIYATGGHGVKNIAIYFSVDVLHPEIGVFPRLLLKGLERAAGLHEEVCYRHYFAAGTDCLWQDRVCILERDARRRLVDGVILFGVYGGEFGDLPVPVVSWQLLPQVKAHVMVDEEAMVRQGLAALRERGCRSIAYMGGHMEQRPEGDNPYLPMHQYQWQLREFFLRESKRLGLQTRPEWTMPSSASTGVQAATTSGAACFRELWGAADQKPDGLISTDDYSTMGALAAMAELGVVPGRDMQVASHTNRGSEVLAGQPVIRLEVDPAEIALALLQTVTALIAGRADAPPVTLVPPHLAVPDRNRLQSIAVDCSRRKDGDS